MITAELNTALNEVVHLMSISGMNFCSAKYAFRNSGYHGFKRLIKNEEKERWELQDKLTKLIWDMGGSVVWQALPAPNMAWADPVSSITALIKLDEQVIEKFHATITGIDASHSLDRVLSHLWKEHHELADVLKEINNAKGDFYAVDQSLHVRYKKRPCQCSKY